MRRSNGVLRGGKSFWLGGRTTKVLYIYIYTRIPPSPPQSLRDISFRWTALWIGAVAYSLVQNNAVERDGVGIICIYIYNNRLRLVNFKLRLISPLMLYKIYNFYVWISSIVTVSLSTSVRTIIPAAHVMCRYNKTIK